MKTPGSQDQTPPTSSGFTWLKVTFFIEVGTSGVNGRNLRAQATMPFPPAAGMKVIARPGDEYREVEEVYWSEAEGTLAFLKFAESGYRQMKKVGWEDCD
jgi:hypothetical protein